MFAAHLITIPNKGQKVVCDSSVGVVLCEQTASHLQPLLCESTCSTQEKALLVNPTGDELEVTVANAVVLQEESDSRDSQEVHPEYRV